MHQELKFVLSIVQLETNRLEKSYDSYTPEGFFYDEFQLNIDNPNITAQLYYKIHEVWSHGLLQLFIKNKILHDQLEVKDIIAFETARLIKLILEALSLEIIKEKEAWGLLFLNAQRLQDTFNNEIEFKEAYLKGSLYYQILFKDDEDDRGTRIKNFHILFEQLKQVNPVQLIWLERDIFDSFTIKSPTTKKVIQTSSDSGTREHHPIVQQIYHLLAKKDKSVLWDFLNQLNENERNQFLNLVYIDKKEGREVLTTEDYLELPALYPNVSYAYYLRGIYFYHFAWEARGTGIANTVGQKNYATFYERLRYAKKDLKKAHELAPNEQTYWGELYNVAKHFNSDEADELEEKLLKLIRKDAMQNTFCLRCVANMKKARWGGSHQEALEWAREVVATSTHGNPIKIMLFEAYIEQYDYILTLDRNEKEAQALLNKQTVQDELNLYFEELLENVENESIYATLLFWYEKVNDPKRLKKLMQLREVSLFHKRN